MMMLVYGWIIKKRNEAQQKAKKENVSMEYTFFQHW